MRAAHRLGLSLVLLACSSPQRPEPAPKVVEAPPPASSAANDAGASRPAPAWLAEALTWPSLTHELRSSHLASPELAEIHVNPEARAAYLALVADSELPSGTRIVQVHRDPATGRSGPIFALVRSAAGWEFFVFDGSGHPLGDAPAHCSGCHAGAPAAPLFGLPRDREQQTQELKSAGPRSPQ